MVGIIEGIVPDDFSELQSILKDEFNDPREEV
jgi:hypothetical protein